MKYGLEGPRNPFHHRATTVAALGLLLVSSAAVAPARAQSWAPEPGDGWDVVDAAEAGFDPAALDRIAADLAAGEFPNTHSVLIERDGALVFEAYFSGSDERWGDPIPDRAIGPDSLHDLRSVSKSVASLVLGIVLHEELDRDLDAAVRRPIGTFLPDLRAPRSLDAVTLHHVLTMTAGLEWNEMDVPYTDETNDEVALYASERPAASVLTRDLLHEPGTTWYYSGGTTQVLAEVVTALTGRSLTDVARERLFAPLGIESFEWLGPGTWEPNPAAMSGLRLSPRDFAKVASLLLHEGRWNGRQVVPSRWVELSTRRHAELREDWSDEGTWGYGYQWWIGDLPGGERLVSGFGNGNQRIHAVPAEDLAITIFAGEYNRFEGHSERLLRRILAARAGD